MRWEGGEQSDNLEDRRGQGGMGGGMFGGRSIGLGTLVIAVVAGLIFGINPLQIIGMFGGMGGPPQAQVQQPAPNQPAVKDRTSQFMSTVLRDTEIVWDKLFKDAGGSYVKPKLVMFSGYTPTACGTGQSAMGPFYCPLDQKVYLDTQFFEVMRRELGGGGDFAEAYVIAHEIGHHVQKQTGIIDKVDGLRGRISQTQQNALQVRVELQADCFAGVWAHHADAQRKILEQGDIEKAMNTAAKIGDDAMQKRQQGYVVPDSFTHGSSAQRVRWFTTGLKTGSIQACDTFNAQNL
ncbi:MAG: neutral zinc metallopeptidase [Brachymonas sp.]|nr:neutral zinc metallopeptidase [Brachymonas sp.]